MPEGLSGSMSTGNKVLLTTLLSLVVVLAFSLSLLFALPNKAVSTGFSVA